MRRLVIAAIALFAFGCPLDVTTTKQASPAPPSPSPSPSPTTLRLIKPNQVLKPAPRLPPEILKKLFVPHAEPVFPRDMVHQFQRPDGVVVERQLHYYQEKRKLSENRANQHIENLEVELIRSGSALTGGFAAAAGAWPWHVTFFNMDGLPFCGGTLIAPQWVLTAGHCDPLPEDTALIGSTDLINGTQAGVSFSCVHAHYQDYPRDNDVALVKLTDPLPLTFVSMPADATFQAAGTSATSIGWGSTDPSLGGAPTTLQQASFPIVDTADCTTAYGTAVTGTMICAGQHAPDVGPCIGDSGGPLLTIGESGEWLEIGVTSWGDMCQPTVYPYGVYARVSDFTAWIDGILHPTTDSEPECRD